jgi:hypothetical protein
VKMVVSDYADADACAYASSCAACLRETGNAAVGNGSHAEAIAAIAPMRGALALAPAS